MLLQVDHVRSRIGCSLDVPLEHCHHACLHDPDHRDIEPRSDEALDPSRAEGLITADDKTSAPPRQLLELEGPESLDVGGWPCLLWVEVAASQIGQPTQP